MPSTPTGDRAQVPDETAQCSVCGRTIHWYDYAHQGKCRECRANAAGTCAKTVYDSSNSRDIVGHLCSFKAVGPPSKTPFGAQALWRYCKRHGGVKVD